MKTALVQLNSTVGALADNTDRIISTAREASNAGARLIVFPELTVSGYPPEDLILKDHFTADCADQLERLKTELPSDACVVVGAPIDENGKKYNAAIAFEGGNIIGIYRKMLLPNYSVFDEHRVFCSGEHPLILNISGKKIALHICEDSWDADGTAVRSLRNHPVDLLINLSASPYHRGKLSQRTQALAKTAHRLNTPLLYCNLIGGQDELVFDGASMGIAADGRCIARAAQFAEDMLYIDSEATEQRKDTLLDNHSEVYEALKLGLTDYVEKIGFKQVIVALSGGIDSALVLALAVDSLGPERVSTVTMPSQYSSSGTLNDALEMAKMLGVQIHTLPIKPLFDEFTIALQSVWGTNKKPGLAEENLQARIRGTLIMALSNETGSLVLSTGNKSEMAMGYSTLYGDMCGGFALIKDVPKTLVFDLCRWRNEQPQGVAIPPTIIERPPSAELRPDQKDTDSLPPYEILDPILEDYVENDIGIGGLITKGYDPDIIRRVVYAVELSEYKRRQAPPGVKITPKAFGRDRRMPIINRYRN